MPLRRRVVMTIALMLAAVAGQAQAQAPASGAAVTQPAASGPIYIVTYFEVGATAASQTVGILRQFAAATRKADGNAGFVALQEIARPGRFAMVEVWRDKPAFEAHAAAVGGLRDRLQPLFASPLDIRTNSGLAVAGPAVGAEPGAGNAVVYVLTHVDVFPAGKDQTIELLEQLAEASRKENGNLRFDVLQQEGRANHLPLVEAWHDAAAQRAHAMAEHTRAFRAKLVPLQGALYDERLYTLVR
jgi:quinol monooxygenase YgiN